MNELPVIRDPCVCDQRAPGASISLYRFLGLVRYRFVNFQDLWNKFSLIFGQLCDKKNCALVIIRIGKKVVWVGGRMGRGHWADCVHFVGSYEKRSLS